MKKLIIIVVASLTIAQAIAQEFVQFITMESPRRTIVRVLYKDNNGRLLHKDATMTATNSVNTTIEDLKAEAMSAAGFTTESAQTAVNLINLKR